MRKSIAMATYNGANYLQEQLDSFVAQTRLPDELVICDDGSTDGTLEIIECFAKNAPFQVRYERNERKLGYARNFNKALNRTTGNLVFLSDQDDVWFPQKLERIESAALNSGALVVMNDAGFADAQLRDLGMTKLGQLQSGGYSEEAFVMGCCAAIDRELLDLCLPIPADFPAHDSWIVSMAIGMGRRVIVREVMQWYRRHESNESNYVVNRTSRITRREVLKTRLVQHLKRSEDGTQENYEEGIVKSLELLMQRAHEATLKVREPLKTELEVYAAALEERVGVERARIALRRKVRPLRIVPVVWLWVLGKYKHCSGLRSVVRDLTLR